jgi:hypothetical protein
MPKDSDRAQAKLPVTAEVGGEGGSYADATVQVDTFKGGAGNERIDPKRVGAVGRQAEEMPAGTDGEDTAATVKPATEHPPGR